jgi:hypothetical protein
MRRQIVIDFPEGASARTYDDVFAAVTRAVTAVAGSAGVAVRSDTAAPRHLPPFPHHPTDPAQGFAIDLRGYDRAQVVEWVTQVRTASPPHPKPSFDLVVRGFRRREVDAWVGQVTAG